MERLWIDWEQRMGPVTVNALQMDKREAKWLMWRHSESLFEVSVEPCGSVFLCICLYFCPKFSCEDRYSYISGPFLTDVGHLKLHLLMWEKILLGCFTVEKGQNQNTGSKYLLTFGEVCLKSDCGSTTQLNPRAINQGPTSIFRHLPHFQKHPTASTEYSGYGPGLMEECHWIYLGLNPYISLAM